MHHYLDQYARVYANIAGEKSFEDNIEYGNNTWYQNWNTARIVWKHRKAIYNLYIDFANRDLHIDMWEIWLYQSGILTADHLHSFKVMEIIPEEKAFNKELIFVNSDKKEHTHFKTSANTTRFDLSNDMGDKVFKENGIVFTSDSSIWLHIICKITIFINVQEIATIEITKKQNVCSLQLFDGTWFGEHCDIKICGCYKDRFC